MKPVVTIILAILSLSSYSQKPPFKFGEVSIEDLKMDQYELDPSAPAVVLADFGESTITYNQGKGFEIRFKRMRRVKILKKEGYDFATLIIPIYKKDNVDEKISGLKGVTVNLEAGKAQETKLEKSGIFTENVNENWDHVKLTMPNVKEGSVIDVSYQVNSPYWFNFQDWEFQTTVPTLRSEYIAYIPEYFEYQRFVQGYVGLKVGDVSTARRTISLNSKERYSGFGSGPTTFNTQTIEYTENSFKWVAEQVPAFKEEPYMTNYRDYISRINFELALIKMPGRPIETVMGTWANINKEFLEAERFGGIVKRSNYLTEIAQSVTAGVSSEEEKIKAIYSYVKKSIEWDGRYRMFSDGNFKKTLEERKGSSADINLLLVSMLQKVNIQSDPVVLSTRDHGLIREQFPLSSQFNYVIASAVVNGKIILLDATDRSLPGSLLPKRCLNGSGLVISENNSKWVDLSPVVKTRSVVDAEFTISEEGKLSGQTRLTKDGYDGHELRRSLYEQGQEKFFEKFADENGWTLHSGEIENRENHNEPVKLKCDFSRKEELDITADVIYVDLFMDNNLKSNPFKLEERKYPVDFGNPFENTVIAQFKVPDNYIVEEIPSPVALALPNGGGRYVYNLNNSNGVLRLTSQLLINKSMFNQVEYPVLREFYAKMIAKQQEQIVLRKAK